MPDPATEQEERARERAANAFHDHPSNPSTCAAAREAGWRRCPCEERWRDYVEVMP